MKDLYLEYVKNSNQSVIKRKTTPQNRQKI